MAELLERSDYWLGRQGRLLEPLVLEAGATNYAETARQLAGAGANVVLGARRLDRCRRWPPRSVSPRTLS